MKSNQDINVKLHVLGRSFKLVGKYNGAHVEARFRCRSGHEFYITPNHAYRKLKHSHCPHCRRKS